MNNPREILGGVFLATIRIPAAVTLRLPWDVSMLSMSQCKKYITSCVILMCQRCNVWRLRTSVSLESMSSDNIGEVIGDVFSPTIWIPGSVTNCFSRDCPMRSVANDSVEWVGVVVLFSRTKSPCWRVSRRSKEIN